MSISYSRVDHEAAQILRTIDVLIVTAGVISAICVVSDDLSLLRQLDAARLT